MIPENEKYHMLPLTFILYICIPFELPVVNSFNCVKQENSSLEKSFNMRVTFWITFSAKNPNKDLSLPAISLVIRYVEVRSST